MQCVQMKPMESKSGEGGGQQRWRVVLSDIRNFIQTMIATRKSSPSLHLMQLTL